MRILVAEDDEALRERLTKLLRANAYLVDQACDGQAAEFAGATESFDAVILDLGLPGVDGISVLRRWRSAGISTPVLVLTARDTWRDAVECLRAGADDYLAKPYESEVLLARVEALIRRSNGRASPVLALGWIEIDPARRQVRCDGEDVPLTGLEFRLIHYLGLNAGRVVPQDELIDHVYGQPDGIGSNVIEVAVSRLRKKLPPKAIATRRGLGYVLRADG